MILGSRREERPEYEGEGATTSSSARPNLWDPILAKARERERKEKKRRLPSNKQVTLSLIRKFPQSTLERLEIPVLNPSALHRPRGRAVLGLLLRRRHVGVPEVRRRHRPRMMGRRPMGAESFHEQRPAGAADHVGAVFEREIRQGVEREVGVGVSAQGALNQSEVEVRDGIFSVALRFAVSFGLACSGGVLVQRRRRVEQTGRFGGGDEPAEFCEVRDVFAALAERIGAARKRFLLVMPADALLICVLAVAGVELEVGQAECTQRTGPQGLVLR